MSHQVIPGTTGSTGRILFVDDEESMCEMMKIVLEKDGHVVDTAADGLAGFDLFRENDYDLVIQDLKMPGMNGIELLRNFKAHNERVPVVILTAFSTWDAAVEAMRLGAYDYLKKPFDNEEVRALVQRALALRQLRTAAGGSPPEMLNDLKLIGATAEIQEVLALIRRVAVTDSTIVIQGESGTGKEVLARLIHLQSLRRQGPFINVNCGAFTETLLESEIFGHKKGAFSGAIADKKSMLEIANGGTFFLDELGEMSPATQVRFLRVLEAREFVPVGGTHSVRVDVRFIAATNRNLEAMVDRGTFREDLFYRLNVIPIHVPPLRERRDDIPLLAGHFLAIYNRAFGRSIEGFEDTAMDEIMRRNWPGNIRELQNTIQRAVTLTAGSRISIADILPARTRSADAAARLPDLSTPDFSLEETMAKIEADYIRQGLEKAGGSLTRAAELLNISFRSIRYKVKKLGLGKK